MKSAIVKNPVKVQLIIDESHHEQLRDVANKKGLSVLSLIRTVLIEFLGKQK